MALYQPHIADEMNRMFPCSSKLASQQLLLGSFATPEMFERTDETFAALSTTFDFSDSATVKNIKRRGVTLTDNLTACVIKCPNKPGIIQVEFTQDSTGSRTIPTPTAVKADGSTAVTINFIGDAFMTESTDANYTDTCTLVYDEGDATLREINNNIGIDES